MIRELTRPGKCLLAGVVGNIKGHCEPICLRVALKIRKCLVLLKSFYCQKQFLHLVVPVISRHQRLPRLWLDPVKWWAIGFSFQLAINQQSVCTSSAWLLPPGQGRLNSSVSGHKIVITVWSFLWATSHNLWLNKSKSLQHPEFPSSHLPQYYPGPTLLNFGDRMSSGAFNVVWS